MKVKGFTLLELMITMFLFLSLSIVGIGSYTYFMKKNEQKTFIDELRTAIQYAKMQAIILGNSVYLAPLDVSSSWSNGMVLNFLNKKTNKIELIYQWQWSHPHWDLNWVGVSTTNKIVFSTHPGQAISNGHFILINKDTREQVVIILNRLGRIRISNNLSLMR
ncbi:MULTISPECIES: GspH/FimT family pseudopilin [Legionella]|uniref:Type II secretion system protein H n=1 Tax=Legionella resiliens TaxID=2905958 RepID=A0ABS8X6D5_9GAMM|nr:MULTISPECIES: GspH/FimT family pseudopilin [unclassified Legionella]MCE0723903.1 GspH/FimT family pseudopilin [Legionella sp. 9fVS26]MCE3533055.1 GspH/FimT family pseudopilin [Legionella sp. 8cVS16]QLZ69248.1 prepilin-type cleavage/methylation domain-containing protein [Legionella sp. PC1000]